MFSTYKNDWFGNIRGDILAGIVVCLALFPEVTGFMIAAGVDPIKGVYATFFITATAAFFGARTGMISAAAGSVALVLAGLVAAHGTQYLLAATILAGMFQILLGFLKIGNLMKYIPKPVMYGFVNGLGLLMFKAQIQHFTSALILPVLGAFGILIIILFPKITKKIPAPIISIILITLIVTVFHIPLQTLGDIGNISGHLPVFALPDVPFSFHFLNGLVMKIPVVALAAVMLVVSFETINWTSVRTIRSVPKSEAFVMVLTVAIVVATNNLACGVLAGTIMSAVFMAFRMSAIQISESNGSSEYDFKVQGHLFFASAGKFLDFFKGKDLQDNKIIIDISAMTVWDSTAIDAIDKVICQNKESGTNIVFIGKNRQSEEILGKISRYADSF